MSKSRLNTIARLVKGLVASILLTLILMLILAIAVVYCKFSDTTILWLNQFIKITSIVFGVGIAVGRGGQQGFISGMVLAIIYMVLGYVLYLTFGGNVFNAITMLGEILIGAAIGGVTGAIFANLPPRKNRRKR